MIALKLRSVGNSVGTTVPRELLEKLRVDQGDTVYVQERDDGSFVLTTYDPEVISQIQVVKTIMRRDRTILKALA